MKILILGGFLGSGKTTALMKLARFMVDTSTYDGENKVVILENEVGEVGIDDKFLRSGGFQVNNLFSGCACCTVSGELVSAAAKIRDEMNPEWLIVETTGIAYPVNMRENLLQALNLPSRICILTDASRWKRLLIPMNSLLRSQLQDSDAVLINKTDLASDEDILKMEADILEFEPNARMYRISATNPVPDDIWRCVLGIQRGV